MHPRVMTRGSSSAAAGAGAAKETKGRKGRAPAAAAAAAAMATVDDVLTPAATGYHSSPFENASRQNLTVASAQPTLRSSQEHRGNAAAFAAAHLTSAPTLLSPRRARGVLFPVLVGFLLLCGCSIKQASAFATGSNGSRPLFNPVAAASNLKAAASSIVNATKNGAGGAALRTVPARTGVGMLHAAHLSSPRVPRESRDAVAVGSNLAATTSKACGTGIGFCAPGLCCSQSGFCSLDPFSCDGTCQREYSGMNAPCNGAYPKPVPKDELKEAAPGGVCGVYVAKCPQGQCCTQFGFCAPARLGNGTAAETTSNFWCGIGSCIKDASPGAPECAIAHALLTPAVRRFKLSFEWGDINPDGVAKRAILVNGQFPGPTIEVNLGDQVVVELDNKLDDVSLLHFHGMLQVGSPGEDGVQWITQNPVPGTAQTSGLPQPDSDPNAPPKFMYSFVASVPGTFWYHSHYDVQYADGARGAFIVKAPPSLSQLEAAADTLKLVPPPPPPPPPPSPLPTPPANAPKFVPPLVYEADVPVLLFDNYHTPYTELQAWYTSVATNPDGVEPVPDSVLINGIGQGYCGDNPVNGTDQSGRPPCDWAVIKAVASPCSKPKTRLRLINGAAFAPIDVYIDAVSKFVVEIDSVAINPLFVEGPVRLNVGQRVSLAICSDKAIPQTVFMRASMDQAAFYAPSPAPVSAAVVHFGPLPWDGVLPVASPWLPLPPSELRPQAFQQANSLYGPIAFNKGMRPPPATTNLTLVISAGTIGDSNAFFFNDVSFQPPDTPSFLSRLLGNPSGIGVEPNAAPGTAGWNVQNFGLGQVVDVIINNHDAGQHPIHLHGSWFTVMAQGAENDGDYSGQPLRPIVLRDTHTLPASSYIVLRVPVFNNMPQMLHCHIEPHLGVGLSMVMNNGLT